jgi:hypothetical protein
MADVEQVLAFFQDKSQNRAAAEVSAHRLQLQLEKLKEKASIFKNVELSEHMLEIVR